MFWGSSWLSPVLQLPGDCPALPAPSQVLQQPGPVHLQSPAQGPFGCTHLSPKKKRGQRLLSASLPDFQWNAEVTFVTCSESQQQFQPFLPSPRLQNNPAFVPLLPLFPRRFSTCCCLGEHCSQLRQTQGESQTPLLSFQGWTCEKWEQMLRFWPLTTPCLRAPHKDCFWFFILPRQE